MRDPATEIAPGTIRFERYMPGPIPRIWDYLTHPTIRGRWLATGPMDQKIGGKYELHFRHDELTPHAEIAPEKFASPKGIIVRGEITEYKFPHILGFTWSPGGPDSKISVVLTQLTSQIRVSFIIEGLADRETQIETAAHWHAHLNVLEAKSNNLLPPPFWKRVAEYEKEYRTLFREA